MTGKSTSPKLASKAGWLAANDSGPHLAVLPSGLRANGEHEHVKITIPDSAALLRSGVLPDDLREAGIVFSSHPDGPDELMRELVITAALRGPGQDTLARLIRAGNELVPYLIAEMLVQPKVKPEEVTSLPEMDRRMLLEFAERRRNVDAAGNKLPIVSLREWLNFRSTPDDNAGAGAGGANGADAARDLSDADAENV